MGELADPTAQNRVLFRVMKNSKSKITMVETSEQLSALFDAAEVTPKPAGTFTIVDADGIETEHVFFEAFDADALGRIFDAMNPDAADDWKTA